MSQSRYSTRCFLSDNNQTLSGLRTELYITIIAMDSRGKSIRMLMRQRLYDASVPHHIQCVNPIALLLEERGLQSRPRDGAGSCRSGLAADRRPCIRSCSLPRAPTRPPTVPHQARQGMWVAQSRVRKHAFLVLILTLCHPLLFFAADVGQCTAVLQCLHPANSACSSQGSVTSIEAALSSQSIAAEG
jgi:hypothetical protein